ncbi:hypothetical protein B484DRAFT_402631 [Ochromonadaceae sp. CCMP2298]|nr:hypothetical protein B484DRAFT_402631 [Ochromonadaceae sp. CCMP2298]
MKAWSSDEDWYERRAEELERLRASEAPVRAALELRKTTDKLFGEEYAAYGLYVLDNQVSTKLVQDGADNLEVWSTVAWLCMPIIQHQAKVECRALIVMAYTPKGYEDPLEITKSGSRFVNSSIDLLHRATSGGHTPEEWLCFINHFDVWIYSEPITRENGSKFDLGKLLKAHPTLVKLAQRLCVKLFLKSPGVLPESLPPVGVFGTAARTFMPCEDLVPSVRELLPQCGLRMIGCYLPRDYTLMNAQETDKNLTSLGRQISKDEQWGGSALFTHKITKEPLTDAEREAQRQGSIKGGNKCVTDSLGVFKGGVGSVEHLALSAEGGKVGGKVVGKGRGESGTWKSKRGFDVLQPSLPQIQAADAASLAAALAPKPLNVGYAKLLVNRKAYNTGK